MLGVVCCMETSLSMINDTLYCWGNQNIRRWTNPSITFYLHYLYFVNILDIHVDTVVMSKSINVLDIHVDTAVMSKSINVVSNLFTLTIFYFLLCFKYVSVFILIVCIFYIVYSFWSLCIFIFCLKVCLVMSYNISLLYIFYNYLLQVKQWVISKYWSTNHRKAFLDI